MSVEIRPFGTTKDGQAVQQVILKNDQLEVRAMTYGAAVTGILFPDREGTPTDLVLGYDQVAQYEGNTTYAGALVGRNCNRLGGSRVTIEGVEYPLTPNENTTQLHGGPDCFSWRVFEAEVTGEDQVTFTLHSPDGDQGYPGNLTAQAIYSLEGSSFTIQWRATTDKTTICNFTNHSYFNLNGHQKGGALAQRLQLEGDYYTPTNSINLPTGELVPVAGTPMDFTKMKRLDEDILADYPQLVGPRGYDHNFVLRGEGVRRAATLIGDATGIQMDLYTDQIGLQLYTGNWFLGSPGKGGAPYCKYAGAALEPQAFPDTPNHPQFGSTLLYPGQTYQKMVRYQFSLVK